jgi:DNA N-6-adenine-methyltransferase (Dam)
VGDSERYTPEDYASLVAEVFGGGISLDPASCARANYTVRATHYYDMGANGLIQPWFGDVFLNPPYDNMPAWVDKLLDEFNRGMIRQAILLSNTSTETKWFDTLCCPGNRTEPVFCHVTGRIKFRSGTDKNEDDPRYASTFTYFGFNKVKFYQVFSRIGKIFKLAGEQDFAKDQEFA